MARQRKPASIPLSKVNAGDAFLTPLEDGRLGACRVLRTQADPSQVLVVASTWIGTEPPNLTDPRLREVLCPTHHRYEGEPYLAWVTAPVPATFIRLGVVVPTEEEMVMYCARWTGGWESFPQQVFWQWRWDNERDQVLAEDEAKRQAEESAREQKHRAYKPLPRQTLEELREQTPFPHWSEFTELAALRGSRRIIRELIDALIELGPDAPEPVRFDEIRHSIERFNALDTEQDNFIMSLERDNICDLLRELAGLIGLDDYGEAICASRDW